MEIVIAYTSDTHGEFRDEKFVKGLKTLIDEHKPVFILDGGDAVGKGKFAGLHNPELSTMVELGYDAMAIGNNEFGETPFYMKRKVGQKFPFLLAANLRIKRIMAFLLGNRSQLAPQSKVGYESPIPFDAYEYWPAHPYVICKKNGISLTVIGLMPNNIFKPLDNIVRFFTAPFRLISPLPVIQSLQEVLPSIREKSDAIIVIGHVSQEENSQIMGSDIDFNLLLGAHKHIMKPAPENGTKRPFIQCFIDRDNTQNEDKPNVSMAIIKLQISDDPKLLDYHAYNVLTGEDITPHT